MKIMFNFFKAILLMPMPWIAWVGLLIAVNMIGPLFFIATLEAKVVLGTMMLSAVLMMFIFAQKGFVRLMGLGHILWIPLILWLWGRDLCITRHCEEHRDEAIQRFWKPLDLPVPGMKAKVRYHSHAALRLAMTKKIA